MGRRGIHTKPNNGNSVDWITPPEVIDALNGRHLFFFDLDPCAHPEQPWNCAKHNFTPPNNGLEVDWFGQVWLNPPYGSALKTWLQRLAEHGAGVALVPARTETAWFFSSVWGRATSVLFLQGRLYFRRPDGSKAGNAGHGSALVAYGKRATQQLVASDLPGHFVLLRTNEFYE